MSLACQTVCEVWNKIKKLCILYLLKIWKYYYLFILNFIIINKYRKILFIFLLFDRFNKNDSKVGGTNDTLLSTFQKVGGTCPPATPMHITICLWYVINNYLIHEHEISQTGHFNSFLIWLSFQNNEHGNGLSLNKKLVFEIFCKRFNYL